MILQTKPKGRRDMHRNQERLARCCLLALCGSLLGSLALCQRSDPSTGKIRILYIGDGWGPSPVPLLLSDPAFKLIAVPTSTLHGDVAESSYEPSIMRKFVRLYIPRTYERMVSEYDLTILSDANMGYMGGNHLQWIRDSTAAEGFGLIMVGGVESFGAPKGTPWLPLEDMLPVTITLDIPGGYYYPSFKVEPARDHPFTRSLPWESIPLFHGMNRLTLKDGAILLLKAEGHPHPPLSYWDYGNGRTVAHAPDWTPASGADVMRWEFYLDYVANIAHLATRTAIPQDPFLVHSLRTTFYSTRVRLTSITDTLDFIERFGANTQGVQTRISFARDSISEAERLFVIQDFDATKSLLADVHNIMVDIQREAIQLKNDALFWVYAIEWIVVSATTLIAGLLLWTLMVRRTLYREIDDTRMRSRVA